MATNDSIQENEFNQKSFIGGMNLLSDDTRLQDNQYRVGFDLTNRFDELDNILMSQEDVAIPKGIKQGGLTFGNFVIVFIAGFAWYRFYLNTGWTQIMGFQMSSTAPRFWHQTVPVGTTNYVRLATTGTINTGLTNTSALVQTANVAGANQGNLPGLLVQDNINQPQFIFIGAGGVPIVRTTQKFVQWQATYTDATNTVFIPNGDQREYVPIGNSMAWDNGVLYVTSQDTNFIYRSVTGRPLDFAIAISNTLATNAAPANLSYTDPITGIVTPYTIPAFTQVPAGDATTTSYSVGVGGITTLRQISTGGIFVSASNANFAVTQNKTPNAPTIFGEYQLIRTFLFNANCLSDRAIFDTAGDTRFIDLTGVRSFNAIMQQQNEGRNSVFTSTIQKAFNGIVQDPTLSAGILYDNYELYAMQSIFGASIAKYDTINNCWVSFDVSQTAGKRIKVLFKIELAIQRLFAITEDDRLFTLYIGPNAATSTVRTIGVCANILYANYNIKMNNPKSEVNLNIFRCVINNITSNAFVSFVPYVNNCLTLQASQTKNITYQPAIIPSTNPLDLPDVDTQLNNLLFTVPNTGQGWKVFGLITWKGASITQFSMELSGLTPLNPPLSQGVAV